MLEALRWIDGHNYYGKCEHGHDTVEGCIRWVKNTAREAIAKEEGGGK